MLKALKCIESMPSFLSFFFSSLYLNLTCTILSKEKVLVPALNPAVCFALQGPSQSNFFLPQGGG